MSLAGYFENQHVVLTGGSSGIGRAMADKLVAAGAEVTLIARRAEPLERARDELAKDGRRVHAVALDISNLEDVEAKLGAHLDAHPAHMLVNNAGIAMPGRFLETDFRHYREQMEINYFGAVHMCRAVVPRLVSQGSGHVMNVGSLAGEMGIYGYSAYAPSKFALHGFTECLRAELKPLGVQVSLLLPPDTDTPQHTAEMEHLPEETKAIAGNVKMLSAEQVAELGLRGMAAGRFEIVPGMDGRFTVLGNRLLPGVARWVCDNSAAKVTKPSAARGAAS